MPSSSGSSEFYPSNRNLNFRKAVNLQRRISITKLNVEASRAIALARSTKKRRVKQQIHIMASVVTSLLREGRGGGPQGRPSNRYLSNTYMNLHGRFTNLTIEALVCKMPGAKAFEALSLEFSPILAFMA